MSRASAFSRITRSTLGPSTIPGWTALTRIPVGPKLHRQRLCESDDAPFGRRIGGALGITEPAADRRHVDDAAAAGRTQQRDRAPRAEEVAVKIDRERAPPVVERQFLRRQGRPGDAGVVDEDIEAAELSLDLGEQ